MNQMAETRSESEAFWDLSEEPPDDCALTLAANAPADLAGVRERLEVAVDLIGRNDPNLIARLIMRAIEGLDDIKLA